MGSSKSHTSLFARLRWRDDRIRTWVILGALVLCTGGCGSPRLDALYESVAIGQAMDRSSLPEGILAQDVHVGTEKQWKIVCLTDPRQLVLPVGVLWHNVEISLDRDGNVTGVARIDSTNSFWLVAILCTENRRERRVSLDGVVREKQLKPESGLLTLFHPHFALFVSQCFRGASAFREAIERQRKQRRDAGSQ